ncbi:MAG: NAD(+)/NADH kinase, partial [Deltaproteobacteria bacterium]|nr:NAD(+)/NADH kinase [Deltaproteobacteria bacterium]
MSFLHKVCLLAKKHNPEAMVLAKTVGDFLGDKGVKVFYLEKDADYSLQPELNQIDLFLVFGGDGTMINAARHLAGTNIPLAGINLGRVGFLLELTRANWQAALTKALEQGFERDERML